MVNKKKITILHLVIITTLIIPIFFCSSKVTAVSSEQRSIFNKSISYFNVCTTDGASSGGNISSAIAAANDNAEAIFNVLTTTNFEHNGGKPMNAVQAAAVLGNIQSESGFDPRAGIDSGNTYKGIAQWGGGRWDAIAEPRDSLENQIKHLIEELDGDYYGNVLQELWDATTEADLAKATFAFTRNFEVAIQDGGGSTKWSNHDNARHYLQGWDEHDTEGYANARWPNAQAQYNLYKDKTPTANSTPTKTDGRMIWVGDSRTVGMSNSVTNGDNVWVAKGSTSYSWFESEGVPKVTETLEDGDTIVFNMGVNGLSEAGKYISKLNSLVDGDWSKAKIIVMSVNPVIDGRNGASNAQIEEFNKAMKEGLSEKIKYKDTYSELKNSLKETDYDAEGLHYTKEVYLKIYNMIRNGGGDGSESTICNSVSNGGATKYATDGAIIYEQCDNRWRNKSFGSTTICSGGCGPSAFAMIVTALTGQSVTPDMTATAGSSYHVEGAGSSHDLAVGIAPKFNVRAEKIDSSVEAINSALNNNGMVWLCGGGPLPFTSGGHCIAIRARTNSGKWLVFDSAGGRDPNAEYDPRTIVTNIHGGTTAVYKN